MRIVVGVDRSEASRAALRYGLRAAGRLDAELVVVHAWQPAFEYVHATETTEVLRAAALRDATELLDELLTEARAERRWAVERVTARPVQGEPAEALIATARDDDLLVVGTSRAGLVRRLLLGSVSTSVVQSARTPVVVVPAGPRPSGRARRRPRARAARRPLAGVRH